jgi:hypothetical protein
MAHGADPNAENAAQIALAALIGCVGLDNERAAFYADVVRLALAAAARAALETMMQALGRHEYQSDFARKYFSMGKAEGTAGSILAVLEARGLDVSAEQKALIVQCTELGVLERWLRHAVSVAAVQDLFG